MPNLICRHPLVHRFPLQIYSSCREIGILPTRQRSACTSLPPLGGRSGFPLSNSSAYSPALGHGNGLEGMEPEKGKRTAGFLFERWLPVALLQEEEGEIES
ncbi:hypothetical protein SLEP1_g50821 [Rubroshorea leprosula]|uniref:Uncharacterized protein n=1 Tax=Rubroshorea leprosula TaxID=152421 RepID=A0AAV5M1B3_9ROSI|nr:hypothetical protein SLEP1_g50821 [Rubroshorea leprosula]